jgi:hypothetical protein
VRGAVGQPHALDRSSASESKQSIEARREWIL